MAEKKNVWEDPQKARAGSSKKRRGNIPEVAGLGASGGRPTFSSRADRLSGRKLAEEQAKKPPKKVRGHKLGRG